MFSVATVHSIYDHLIIEDNLYPNWVKIIAGNNPVLVDLNDNELNLQLEDPESMINLFIQMHANAQIPKALSLFFEAINEDTSNILSEPASAFILDIDETQAEKIKNDYGIAVFGIQKLDDKFFMKGYSKEFDRNDEVADGWKGIIRDAEIPISNSLVINDNYLFDNYENEKNLGAENLISFLDAYLPENLIIDYHIAIITSNTKGKANKFWHQEFGKLKARVSKLRAYSIKLELVITEKHEDTHKRRMISNYMYGWGDKGFDIFKASNKKIVRSDYDIHLNGIFNNIDNKGDNFCQLANKGLKKMQKRCNDVKEFLKNQPSSESKMILGDCNNDNSVNNRLINYI